MRTNRFAAVIAVLAIGALPLATAAGQAEKTAKTKIKITQLSASGGAGTVKSKKKCRKGRKVALKFVGEYGDVTIGTTKTDKAGAWSVDKSLTDRGIYFATVKKKTVGKLTCAAASSKDKRL
jgi:proline racemase